MIIVLKIFLVATVVLVLWSSSRYRRMSQQLDEAALDSIRKMMRSAEEQGFPPEIIPLLIAITAWAFVVSAAATAPFGR